MYSISDMELYVRCKRIGVHSISSFDETAADWRAQAYLDLRVRLDLAFECREVPI